MAINNVNLSGRLTRDPELRTTQGGTEVLDFSIAVSEWQKDHEYANYFDCVMFGKRASSVSQYLSKGSKVSLSGRLHQNRWQDQQGNNRYKVNVVVSDIEFMSTSKKQANEPVADDTSLYEEDIPF